MYNELCAGERYTKYTNSSINNSKLQQATFDTFSTHYTDRPCLCGISTARANITGGSTYCNYILTHRSGLFSHGKLNLNANRRYCHEKPLTCVFCFLISKGLARTLARTQLSLRENQCNKTNPVGRLLGLKLSRARHVFLVG